MLFGEVDSGEGAEEGEGEAVVGTSGFDGRIEWAVVEPLALLVDAGPVFAGLFVLPDAFVAAEGVTVLTAVLAVLAPLAISHVSPAVVQAVAVHVVCDLAFRRLHDLAVHEDRLAVSVPGRIEPAGHLQRMPFIPAEGRIIRRIHNGRLALGQRDILDSVIRWLRRLHPDHRSSLSPKTPAAIFGLDDRQVPARSGRFAQTRTFRRPHFSGPANAQFRQLRSLILRPFHDSQGESVKCQV